MEIVNHRQKILDIMSSNANGNETFATEVISTENVEDKCERSKMKESNLFVFQAINLGD